MIIEDVDIEENTINKPLENYRFNIKNNANNSGWFVQGSKINVHNGYYELVDKDKTLVGLYPIATTIIEKVK